MHHSLNVVTYILHGLVTTLMGESGLMKEQKSKGRTQESK